MTESSPFHSGELAVQERAGESATARRNGRAISARVMAGVRPFLKLQPMLVLATRDARHAMWASLVFGRPGFLNADSGTRLDADLSQAAIDESDPAWDNLEHQRRAGTLVIEPANRRRVRINGRAHIDRSRHLRVEVEECFLACPKYINRRHIRWPDGGRPEPIAATPASLGGLSDSALQTLRSADAMFVATRSGERGYDVSHRGGSPGFVKLAGPATVRWPEFPGNSMFNTLGNLLHDTHAGLVVPDFTRGRVLQLTGRAVARWGQSDGGGETGGTGRYVELGIERWREQSLPSNLVTEFVDFSPFNPPAGQAPDPLH